MAVGRKVPPNAHVAPDPERGHAESAVVDFIFMHVEKDEQPRGIRVADLGELSEARIHVGKGIQFRRAVNAKAHVVTAPAELVKLYPIERCYGGSVRGAMI